MFEIDDGEGRRESREDRTGQGDVPVLKDFEPDEMLKLVESSDNLVDRRRIFLLLNLAESDSILRNREVERMSLFTEFRVFLERLAVTILLLLRPAVRPDIADGLLFARDGKDALEVEARARDARDSLRHDSETEEILASQILVHLLLHRFGETIQSGSEK